MKVNLGSAVILGTLRNPNRWNYPALPDNITVTQVEVCWETASGDLARERELSRLAVEGSWEVYALIDFTGWGNCTPDQQGIRIQATSNEEASVRFIGNKLNRQPGGLDLNIAHRNWQGTACENIEDQCLAAIAIHEFGHALGMPHEAFNRRGLNGAQPCPEGRSGPAPDVFATNYDPDSIMNYCNDNWIAGQLSCRDRLTAQVAYGARVSRNCVVPEIDL